MVQDDNTNIVPIGNTTVIWIQDDSTNLCTGNPESNTVCWVLFVGYATSDIRAFMLETIKIFMGFSDRTELARSGVHRWSVRLLSLINRGQANNY